MLFPTRHKSKISSKLSYPIGAELISSELAPVPQAQSFDIRFHDKYEWMETRGEPYPILTVHHNGTADFFDAGWHIAVEPIPRVLKHEIAAALKSEFFTLIRQWLQKDATLNARHGQHEVRVIFDERGETMLRLEEYHRPGEALSN